MPLIQSEWGSGSPPSAMKDQTSRFKIMKRPYPLPAIDWSGCSSELQLQSCIAENQWSPPDSHWFGPMQR